ncbi:MAG: alanine racemase, partial [Nocardioides sp.]
MSLTLRVDGNRWRAHLTSVAARTPGLVPVAKGNGYGFGLGRLARRIQWLADTSGGAGRGGVGDTLAVGTYTEIEQVASRCDASLLVLTPWRPFVVDPPAKGIAKRLIHTVGRLEDLEPLAERHPGARVVLE